MKSLYNFVILSLILCNISDDGWAFPELIRDGYSSCRSCHVQPNGGGPLTPYGRTIAGDHLSTFGDAEKGGLFYGLYDLPPSIDLAGDYRFLVHKYDDKSVSISQKFVMQKELSLVLKPAENLTLVASTGYYGFEPKEMENRRYFALLTHDGFLFRVGRFLPTWGINIPDHTKGIKELFGQGRESLNVEAGYTHKYFELIGTRLLGGDSYVETGTRPTVQQKDERDGFAGQLNISPFKGAQVGFGLVELSSAEKVRRSSVVHVFLGNSGFYGHAEYQSHPNESYKAYGQIGAEVIKGLHFKVELDQDELEREVFGSAVWYPYPHFEFTASFSDRNQIFTSHYYL